MEKSVELSENGSAVRFLSRQTIILFVLASVVVLPLALQARGNENALSVERAVAPVPTGEDASTVGFIPSHIWREPSVAEKALALESFVFLIGFAGSFFTDVFWAFRRQARR
jgi:hypothetical protein